MNAPDEKVKPDQYLILFFVFLGSHGVEASTVTSQQEDPGFNYWVGTAFLCGVCRFSFVPV